MLSDDSGDVLSAEAGSEVPPFTLAAMDGFGNRTAPSANDGWQVTRLFSRRKTRLLRKETLQNVQYHAMKQP